MQQYIDKLQERYVDQPVKWATLGGFLVMIIGAFGSWWTVSVLGITASENAFQYGFSGTLVFLLSLAGLAAILVYAFANLNIERVHLMWGLVAGALLIDLFVLISFIDITGSSGVSVGWGLWLTILGAIAVSVGAIVPMWGEIRARADQMRSSGGNDGGSGGGSDSGGSGSGGSGSGGSGSGGSGSGSE